MVIFQHAFDKGGEGRGISVIFVDSVFVEEVQALGYSFVDKEVCRLLSGQDASSIISGLLASLLLLGFSLLGAVFMFPQINVHIITWVCGSYKTYCFGVSQVLAQRCWHQYVCSPISVPNISTQSFLHNYLQSFVGSSLQSLFGDFGFRSQL